MSKALKNNRIAVVLFNLGGPDNLESVRHFLFNLFNDKYIIPLPSFFRRIVALIISHRREKIAKEIYAKMGGKSTILEETKNQARALKKYLSYKLLEEFEIFICMRHWNPMSSEVIKQLERYSPNEIILIPLYPQFSTTTTASSIDDFMSKKNKSSLKDVMCKAICCYHNDKNFIKSHAKLIIDVIDNVKDKKNYRVLFSAHGLPKRIIDSGDPYQWQIESSVKNIIDEIFFEIDDYKITYQSKVGPVEWIGPSTEEEIELAAKEGLEIVIVPVSFVSEHSETLVELDIEYKEIADRYNVDYYRVPTLRINDSFIKSLGDIVLKSYKKNNSFLSSSDFVRVCPNIFSKCLCKIQNI